MLRHSISAALAVLVSAGAHAQSFPTKPIRLLTGASGGGADLAARVVALELTPLIGQQVVVENFGGAGFQGEQQVMKAVPDGHTLLAFGPPFWIGPLLAKAPYDVLRDFAPVALTVSSPNILVIHASVPANNVKEFIALAKAKPGSLNYASGLAGSSNHLAAELFKSLAGVDLVRVAYKSGGSALTDLLAGRVQVSFSSSAVVGAGVQSGKLRALGVTSAQATPLAPGLPPLSEAGVPGYESVSINAVFAPIKTPPAIVNQLNQGIVRGLNRPEVKERLFKTGAEPVQSTPQQTTDYVRAEIERMGKVIREAGIKAEE